MNFKKWFSWIFIAVFLCGTIFAATPETPAVPDNAVELSSKGAIIGETTTDEILYEYHADDRLYPASTTKLMTALVAVEHCKPTDILTVPQSAVEGLFEQGSSVFLKTGEQMAFQDMLAYLLIPSGNDAANTIADHISGSPQKFADLMNEKAKELGCTNTHFTNPNGLHDENHYTSARDLYLIAKAAMKNDLIRKIVSTVQTDLPVTNMHASTTTITTTNHLISRIKDGRYFNADAIGIKTGTTTPAGFCLIAGFDNGDLEYISVVLGGKKDADTGDIGCYSDTLKLYKYVKDNFAMQTLAEKDAPIKEVPLQYCSGQDFMVLSPAKDFSTLAPKGILKSATVEYKVDCPKTLAAPIKKGEKLGTARLYINDKEYGSIDLVASSSAERSKILYAAACVTNFFKSTVFRILLAALLAFLLILFVTKSLRRRNNRSRHYSSKRRYRR